MTLVSGKTLRVRSGGLARPAPAPCTTRYHARDLRFGRRPDRWHDGQRPRCGQGQPGDVQGDSPGRHLITCAGTASTSALTMVLSVTFFDCGIRAMRRQWSYNDTDATRLPVPAALGLQAITPSSDTATVHATSVSSRTLARTGGVASQRTESALGSVQRALRGRHVAQHTQHLLGLTRPGERSASRLTRHAPSSILRMPTLRSIAATARSPGRGYSVRIAATGPTAFRDRLGTPGDASGDEHIGRRALQRLARRRRRGSVEFCTSTSKPIARLMVAVPRRG